MKVFRRRHKHVYSFLESGMWIDPVSLDQLAIMTFRCDCGDEHFITKEAYLKLVIDNAM